MVHEHDNSEDVNNTDYAGDSINNTKQNKLILVLLYNSALYSHHTAGRWLHDDEPAAGPSPCCLPDWRYIEGTVRPIERENSGVSHDLQE